MNDASLFNGNYKVAVDDWADYGIGDIIPVQYVPADGLFKFRIKNTNNPYISSTTSYLLATINPATSAVTLVSNEPYDYGVAPTNITGTGTVASCTGNINLKLTFTGGYNQSGQTFNLVKI